MKLLLVEDDAEAAAYLKKALSEVGHTVDHAATGREGLMLAAGEAYDVIDPGPHAAPDRRSVHRCAPSAHPASRRRCWC